MAKERRYQLDREDVDLDLILEVNAERLTPEVLKRIFELKVGESVVLFDELANTPLRRVQ